MFAGAPEPASAVVGIVGVARIVDIVGATAIVLAAEPALLVACIGCIEAAAGGLAEVCAPGSLGWLDDVDWGPLAGVAACCALPG
jgi:hypothetical protein